MHTEWTPETLYRSLSLSHYHSHYSAATTHRPQAGDNTPFILHCVYSLVPGHQKGMLVHVRPLPIVTFTALSLLRSLPIEITYSLPLSLTNQLAGYRWTNQLAGYRWTNQLAGYRWATDCSLSSPVQYSDTWTGRCRYHHRQQSLKLTFSQELFSIHLQIMPNFQLVNNDIAKRAGQILHSLSHPE